MILQKIKKLGEELPIGFHYKVVNRKDEMGVPVKVLLIVSHGMKKKGDEATSSIYANTGIFTYYPKQEEVKELMLELIDDHRKELQQEGFELLYDDIQLERKE